MGSPEAARKKCARCGASILARARVCRYCGKEAKDEPSRSHKILVWLGWRSEQPRSYPQALDAYLDYEDREKEQSYRGARITELDLYNVYREYMKHEDSLLTTRLGSFLTMNTFLIAASVVILGGITQLLTKKDVSPERELFLIAGAAMVHCVIAAVGYESAKLTQKSLMSATESLSYMRDRGNYRLRAAISRGDFPYLSNGRGLSDDERAQADQGFGFMREIPRRMKLMWLVMFLIPLPIVGALRAGLTYCPRWNLAAPVKDSLAEWLLRPALCAVKPEPTAYKLRAKPGTIIELVD